MSRPARRFRALFLCTGNSARSILAEHLLARLAPGRFESWSAGSQPRGTVHPLALEVLAALPLESMGPEQLEDQVGRIGEP